MRSASTAWLLILWLSGTALADDPGGLRIENEFKLSIPPEDLEDVREYLRARYGEVESGILRELGGDFSARISDEWFRDRYFDTEDLRLLEAQSGVRARLRQNSSIGRADPKHGRELLQLKLNRPSDENALNRSEIKFAVDRGGVPDGPLDQHPVLGLIDNDDRPLVIAALQRELRVDATDLRPLLTLTQRRWRVYVSRDGAPFATLTLDEVRSRWFLWSVDFVELEIELNEIAYTDASDEQRAVMQDLSQRLADDLREAFPAIVQDQTPKYNKAFLALSDVAPGFTALAPYRDLLDALSVLIVVPVTILVVAVARRVSRREEKRRREQVW